MRFDEYQAAALRTMADSTRHDHNKCICALRLCGEAGEWRWASGTEEFIKETGDVMWYVTATAYLHRRKWTAWQIADFIGQSGVSEASTDHQWGVAGAAMEVAEIVKKAVGHGHEGGTDALRTALSAIVVHLWLECRRRGVDLGDVMAANIAKLKRRYPNGFNSADSIACVDVASPVGGGGSGAG